MGKTLLGVLTQWVCNFFLFGVYHQKKQVNKNIIYGASYIKSQLRLVEKRVKTQTDKMTMAFTLRRCYEWREGGDEDMLL